MVKDGSGFTLEGGAMVLADNGLALAQGISFYIFLYNIHIYTMVYDRFI